MTIVLFHQCGNNIESEVKMKSSYVNKCNCKVLNTLLCICELKGVKSLVWTLAPIK